MAQVDAGLSRTFERLSTGMRITHASDDPAGLAVSSTLDTKTRLYGQAERNIRDGLSALDILDGALGEQSGILTRLSELAEQSANGSLSTAQRKALQGEYSQLLQEFARTASTTTFNGQKLALADREGVSALNLQTGINGSSSATLSALLSDTGNTSGTLGSDLLIADTLANQTAFFSFADTTPTEAQILERYGMAQKFTISSAGSPDRNVYFVYFGDATSGGVAIRTLVQQPGQDVYNYGNFETEKASIDNYALSYDPSTGRFTTPTPLTLTIDSGVGSTVDVTLDLRAMRVKSGATSMIDFTGLENASRARSALDVTRARLAEIASLRGTLGASASRLEASLAVSSVARENNAAALSRIRDIDVATESSQLVRQQILRQTATAVLAQASQQPSIALKLLAA